MTGTLQELETPLSPEAAYFQSRVRLVSPENTHLGIKALPRLRDAIAACSAEQQMLAVDLAKVETVDSGGLGALVAAVRWCGSDRHLALTNTPLVVMEAIKTARLEELFSIAPPNDTAPMDVQLLRLARALEGGEAVHDFTDVSRAAAVSEVPVSR